MCFNCFTSFRSEKKVECFNVLSFARLYILLLCTNSPRCLKYPLNAKTKILQDVRGENMALKLRTTLLTLYAVHISRNTVPTIFTNSRFSQCVHVMFAFLSHLAAYSAMGLEYRSLMHCVLLSSALNASHVAR